MESKQKGWIFDIQRYSIHDGPGIRSTIFLRGCPLRCFWCQNPESQELNPQMLFYRDRCVACGKCVSVCPEKAITISGSSSKIDRSKCTGCGRCAEICPNEAVIRSGVFVSVEEIMVKILKDRILYNNSGGGITLSGGDPLFQNKFALEILVECKNEGLHTAIETCGYLPWKILDQALEYTDLVLFDIKHLDAKKHEEGTGLSNELILENARKIATLKDMRIRVPLIPGYNDSIEHIKAIKDFVDSELGSFEIDLMPYNKMGEVKYKRLGQEPVLMESQDDEYLQKLKDIVAG